MGRTMKTVVIGNGRSIEQSRKDALMFKRDITMYEYLDVLALDFNTDNRDYMYRRCGRVEKEFICGIAI